MTTELPRGAGRRESGFSLVEMLVAATVLMLLSAAAGLLMVQSARVNKSEQLRARTQSAAQNATNVVVQVLRSAGWDPTSSGIAPVTLDPTPGDGVETLEVFADLNADGDVDDDWESVLFRFSSSGLELRRQTGGTFETIAFGISNDADGDGTAEDMFTPDSVSSPELMTVRITATSPHPDPLSGQPIRYSVETDVALRSAL